MPGHAFSSDEAISRFTDHYFKNTKEIVRSFGDIYVKYAVFMRRPVVFTPRLMLEGLKRPKRYEECLLM